MDTPKKLVPGNSEGIFVASFKHWRSGEIIYAKDKGKKAFFIPKKRKPKTA